MFFDSTHILDRYTQKQGFICYEKLLFFDFQIENMTWIFSPYQQYSDFLNKTYYAILLHKYKYMTSLRATHVYMFYNSNSLYVIVKQNTMEMRKSLFELLSN